MYPRYVPLLCIAFLNSNFTRNVILPFFSLVRTQAPARFNFFLSLFLFMFIQCWSSFRNVHSFPLRRGHLSFCTYIFQHIYTCLVVTKFKWSDCSPLLEVNKWKEKKKTIFFIAAKKKHLFYEFEREKKNSYGAKTNCTFSLWNILRDNFLRFKSDTQTWNGTKNENSFWLITFEKTILPSRLFCLQLCNCDPLNIFAHRIKRKYNKKISAIAMNFIDTCVKNEI